MNLEKLFKIQAELDKRIIEKHGLQNEDLLDKKILALQVELGELANEWRGFKFWSEDRELRTEIFITSPKPNEPLVVKKNPLLEEYVDCLHFILSIGLDSFEELTTFKHYQPLKMRNVVDQFGELFYYVSGLIGEEKYIKIVALFLGLGEMLGFTWEQIETAYLEKNKINHERQESGY